jgi:hypothetical protein
MSNRLRALCESMVRLLGDGTQMIRLDVTVAGECPEALQQLVLRVAHEFVGNAVTHGMRARLVGSIAVHLATDVDGRTALTVTDDGWGFEGSQIAGDGLKIAGDLAASARGTVSLRRTDVTVAALELPSPWARRVVAEARHMDVEFSQNRREVEDEIVDHDSVAARPGSDAERLHRRSGTGRMVLLPPVSLRPLMPPHNTNHALRRCGHEAGWRCVNKLPASPYFRRPRRGLFEPDRNVGMSLQGPAGRADICPSPFPAGVQQHEWITLQS